MTMMMDLQIEWEKVELMNHPNLKYYYQYCIEEQRNENCDAFRTPKKLYVFIKIMK